MKIRMLTTGGLLALAALGLPQGHFVEYKIRMELGDQHSEIARQQLLTQGLLQHGIDAPGYGSVQGSANPTFGINRSFVTLNGLNANNPLSNGFATSVSRYCDTIVISHPLLNGTYGKFTASLYVSGRGGVDASPSLLKSWDTFLWGSWKAVINIGVKGLEDRHGQLWQNATYTGEWYKDFQQNTLEYYGDRLNAYQQDVEFLFVYGRPIFLDTFTETHVEVDNRTLVPGTVSATVDLGNSSYWGGIRNLRDAHGNAVKEFDYSSSSGFNYFTPAYELTVAKR